MSKPWGGAGAWALDAEQEDHLPEPTSSPNFPSLKEAVSTKQPKKKKPVAIPLSQFNAPSPTLESKGLTTDELLRLPTGPRQRSQDELEQGRLGGGFRSYGAGTRGGFQGRRADDGDGSWGGGRRGFDDDGRRGPSSRDSEFNQPSRADEVDNWGAGKKFSPSATSDRYGSVGGGGPSRADEVDDWGSGKKTVRSSYSGFGESRPAGDSDRWTRGGGGVSRDIGERPKLVLERPKRDVEKPGEVTRSRSSPFGAARPREEVLAEKGVDWKQTDSVTTGSQSSRPSSAHSDRPDSPGLQSEGDARPKPKVNPFGNAKPRELVLEEKGVDWRKKDLGLEPRSVVRPETDEEKKLKEEISYLKAVAKSSDDLNGFHKDLAAKERDLDLLSRQLDDNVKLDEKASANGRPTSGAGRFDASSTRSSQSGIRDESRNSPFIDRSGSRGGTSDVWSRSSDERRGSQRDRERSFFDNRNLHRPSSKGRW